MRPKQFAAIANCVRTRQRSRASQCRGVRKSAGPPTPRLRAAATVPFAVAELEIACALLAMRARQSHGRGNRAALRFRWAIFAVRKGWVATTQRRWRQRGQQGHKGPKHARRVRSLELIGRDNAYA